MSLTPRRKENRASFGRKGTAPTSDGTTPAGSDGAAPAEAQLDLARATLAVDDGLLMVLGPEGDPLPPAALAALAREQPEARVAFDDGRKVPAGRVADVLEAQAGGRLASDTAHGWLEAMLGHGPSPAAAGDDEIEAERDDLEITLFGNELVISTAAAGVFVLAAARPDGTGPPALRLARGDGKPLALEDLLARLRLAAGFDAEVLGVTELALPEFGFARDGDALVLTTARAETFVLAEADAGTNAGVALYTPDGESASFAGLAAALGLGDAGVARSDASIHEEPCIGEETPPGTGPDTDGEASAEHDEALPLDAPASQPPPTTIPLAWRPGDLPNVAIVLITGVPAGATLSAGTDNGDGSWTVAPDQLDALAITPPADASGPLTLDARLVTIDDRDGAMSSVVRTVVTSPEADGSAAGPDGPEAGIRLDLDAVAREAAGDRPASAVVVRGLPNGAGLSAGQFDEAIRSWVIKPGELEGLRLYPGDRSFGPFELRVTVVTMAPGTAEPSATTRRIEVGPSLAADSATDRPPERVGGVGFFRSRRR